MKLIEPLSARLNREHREALLQNYSADYETWLEDRIAQLEAENERAIDKGYAEGYDAAIKEEEDR